MIGLAISNTRLNENLKFGENYFVFTAKQRQQNLSADWRLNVADANMFCLGCGVGWVGNRILYFVQP